MCKDFAEILKKGVLQLPMAAIGTTTAGAAAATRLGRRWGSESWQWGQGSAETRQRAGEDQKDKMQLWPSSFFLATDSAPAPGVWGHARPCFSRHWVDLGVVEGNHQLPWLRTLKLSGCQHGLSAQSVFQVSRTTFALSWWVGLLLQPPADEFPWIHAACPHRHSSSLSFPSFP